MTESKRSWIAAEQKVAILKQHFVDRVPIADLCDEHGIRPSQFEEWQKIFFESGPTVFKRNDPDHLQKKYEKKINRLEEKVQKKDDIITELLHEHLTLKKTLGEE